MADLRIEQLPTALALALGDLFPLAAVNSQIQTGYEAKHITAAEVAAAILTSFEQSGLTTQSKTIVGALNEIAAGGGGGGGSSVLSGTTDPSSAQGNNNDLYVKYSVSGNDVSVVGFYVKLSGTWVTISTGGGGGSSTLADLTDVNITNPTDGQTLKYKAIPNTETESGSVANFTTPYSLPLSACVANVDYNANGITSAKVTRTGKNLAPSGDRFVSFLQRYYAYTTVDTTNKSITFNPTSSEGYHGIMVCNEKGDYYFPFKANTRYTFIIKATTTSSSAFNMAVSYTDGTNNGGFNKSQMSGDYIVWTSPANKSIRSFYFGLYSGTTTLFYDDIAVIEGVATLEDFEAVNREEHDIDFDQTIYGGSLDVKNGVLTSTKAADGSDLPEPIEYDVDPTTITSLAGVNNIWADTGDIEVEYVASFSDSWENANAGSSGSIFVIEMDYNGSDYTFDKTGAEIKDAIDSKMPMFLYYNDYMYSCSDAVYTNPTALLDFGRFETSGVGDGILEAKNIQLSIDASDNIFVTESENEDKYLAFREAHGTLTAGQTTISFGDALSDYTWHNKTLDFYTSIYGVNPTGVSFSSVNRVITLTFEAQQTDMTVKVRASHSNY